MNELGIYIHIPFCIKKCDYCDFISVKLNDGLIEEYINDLIKEIEIYSKLISKYVIDSIFIGGGTPSSIDSKFIGKIFEKLYSSFNIDSKAEITIEVNPGTINKKKLEAYKDFGINRISLGAQSLNDKILQNIGRIHNEQDILNTIKLIKLEGFDNINSDLMIGLPEQTLHDVISSLEKIIELNLTHISLYSLIIEEGTKLYKLEQNGKLNLPNEDEERLMYHEAKRLLEKNGYRQYEISNFSKPDFECKHNLKYWTLKPYVGIGLNSHSNIWDYRYWNYSNFKEYHNYLMKGKLPIENKEYINTISKITEFMILGIRLNSGINREEFKRVFGTDMDYYYKDAIQKNINNGLIFDDGKNIKLTSKGLDLSNIVELDFYI
ncbi:oxygen-independent coproporphyrinogen III oxidase [Soehngenia longivitae]|uniref:Heme chaperone HemW n=1 Tax=Soehngenia longivitae TaxID=2562294 RepID=A0A4Z0D3V7_9FIRM|nr:radical SAM family heme chaperone HemW [Soehngenia longivitae]TFZ40045.1 oxygen-independent coproporphyrinogen III oxidase [Soehngenia longivitae]